ncbi:abortive infection system antitoxin AbiGi family protein [Candidatus Poribacteria bacterium]
MDREWGQTLRSEFLVHWTGGKDIEPKYEEGKISDAERCRKYVDRLSGTLQKGLWMTNQTDAISTSEYTFRQNGPMTCFTEVKLSTARIHAQKYGYLGFGFSRDFIVSTLLGAPVHYVAATGDSTDLISASLAGLDKIIEKLRVENAPHFNKTSQRLHDELKPSILFMKPMSECKDPHDFAMLEEHEWRVLCTKKMQTENMVLCGENATPPAKLTFTQADLKVLVLPDNDTRKMALENDFIWQWLSKERAQFPIIITVEECLQF